MHIADRCRSLIAASCNRLYIHERTIALLVCCPIIYYEDLQSASYIIKYTAKYAVYEAELLACDLRRYSFVLLQSLKLRNRSQLLWIVSHITLDILCFISVFCFSSVLFNRRRLTIADGSSLVNFAFISAQLEEMSAKHTRLSSARKRPMLLLRNGNVR